jgi:hypothetical protein
MPRVASRVILILWAATVVAAAGCTESQKVEPSPVSAYLDLAALQAGAKRVLLVPLANEAIGPDATAGTTAALLENLQERHLFQLVRENPSVGPDGTLPINGGRTLSIRDLAQIRRQTDCDAVLLGAVTSFSSYPNLKIGLYLRLVDLRDSRILWSVQHIWDASDKGTQDRIEQYFRTKMGDSYDPIRWRLATVSPTAFEQFVAYEVAQTLPRPDDAGKVDSHRP